MWGWEDYKHAILGILIVGHPGYRFQPESKTRLSRINGYEVLTIC